MLPIFQIFVSMITWGLFLNFEVEVGVGPYQPESTETHPMPGGKRLELVEYDERYEPYRYVVVVHLPSVESCYFSRRHL